MAHKARKSARRSAPRHRRRASSRSSYRRPRHHTRSNPDFGRMLRSAPAFGQHVVLMALAATAGKIAARKIRGGVFKRDAGTVAGSLIEASVGIGGGLALSSVNAILGEGFAIGGLQAPIETFVQQKQIKGVSDALADDAYYVGGNTGVGLISAFPDDYQNTVGDVGGYVAGPDRGGSEAVAGYLAQLDDAA